MRWTPLDSLPLYYRGWREDVLPHVPKGVRRVLDVGCGAGSFGLAMRSHYGAEVWGIELVEDMGRLAEERLHQVFIGDCAQIIPTLPRDHFDLVTFTDVLEHLPQPGDVLRSVAPILTAQGQVLASLPNIRYWEEFKRLVFDGDFPQEDSGIFDRTHLRFFTQKSIPRLFEENGYSVAKLTGINPTLSKKLKLINLLTAGRYLDCRFLQFLVLAAPNRAAVDAA